MPSKWDFFNLVAKILYLATCAQKTSIKEKTLCGLLANINSAAANMGQSVICVWDGWAFVWQEGLRNRSCWQHVGAELRAGRMAWITEGDREVTTAHCVSPRWAERVTFTAGTGDISLFLLALWSFMKQTLLYSSYGMQALAFEMLPTSTPGETAEYKCLLLLTKWAAQLVEGIILYQGSSTSLTL